MSQRRYEGGKLLFLRQRSRTTQRERNTTNGETHYASARRSQVVSLVVEAVNKPGLIMKAYSAFHHYSIGNQLLAMIQCQLRRLEPGPINTFPGWQA